MSKHLPKLLVQLAEVKADFFMSEKLYEIQLTEDDFDTLLLALRYCELHHVGKNAYGKEIDYKPSFHKLLNIISMKLKQLSFF